mmetsp:Transcript_76293/g.154861  ORF Transcript_76293/g.154861 Transcript_76293/m.154861 type:complete len:121 (-) Transcript_76293:235-597(-)
MICYASMCHAMCCVALRAWLVGIDMARKENCFRFDLSRRRTISRNFWEGGGKTKHPAGRSADSSIHACTPPCWLLLGVRINCTAAIGTFVPYRHANRQVCVHRDGSCWLVRDVCSTGSGK